MAIAWTIRASFFIRTDWRSADSIDRYASVIMAGESREKIGHVRFSRQFSQVSWRR
jgi:hypothetical protein